MQNGRSLAGLKRTIRALAAKLPPLRKALRRVLYISGKSRYRRISAGIRTNGRMILFCAYDGASYACSPKALYEYMLGDSRFDSFSFVWAFKDTDAHSCIAGHPRTSIVKYGTDEHLMILRSSVCWVDNRRVFEYVHPSAEQIYVQCWHGTPLKRLGFDMAFSNNSMNDISEFRWRYRLDAEKLTYMVSPSPFTTKVFASAFGLTELNKTDALLEIGYPRNDALHAPTTADISNARGRIGLPADDKRRIILYAPTFRDDRYTGSGEYSSGIMLDLDRMMDELGDGYIMLLRTHYLVSAEIDYSKYDRFVVDCTGHDDINDLFLVSDILVCDYSSLFFDFANLCKPIIFFMPDLKKYREETRGFYIGTDELPGEIILDEKQLPAAIENTLGSFACDEKYRRFNEKFNPLNDGNAAGRLADTLAKRLAQRA
jgi:CDP-glycerol glycerophosphotransferase